MTNTQYRSCPSPACRCHDCVVEFVKDWEDDYAVYYADEYIGPFETLAPDFDW